MTWHQLRDRLRRRGRSRVCPDRGGGAVEFAIIAAPLLLVSMMVLQTGLYFYARSIALAKGTKSGTSVDDVERWLGRLLNLIGSPNWVSTTHVCNWHKDTGFSYTFGSNLPTPD